MKKPSRMVAGNRADYMLRRRRPSGMVHYTHSCLRAAQRESLCQGCRQRRAPILCMDGLTLHIRHMPTEYAGLERPADINEDCDGNSTAGSIAVSSRRPYCNRHQWAGTRRW